MKESQELYQQQLKIFSRQLGRQRDQCIEYTPDKSLTAWWELELFKASYDLTITDWINLRGDGFFEARDNMRGKIEKMKFTLMRINQYKQSK